MEQRHLPVSDCRQPGHNTEHHMQPGNNTKPIIDQERQLATQLEDNKMTRGELIEVLLPVLLENMNVGQVT